MPVPQVFGVTIPSLALSGATLFVRWRLPQVPHYIASPGVAAAVGTLVLSSIPDIRMGTLIAGAAALACAAFAVEWQLAQPKPGVVGEAKAVPAPTSKAQSAPATQREPATQEDRKKVAEAIVAPSGRRITSPHDEVPQKAVQAPAAVVPPTSMAPTRATQTMISPEAQKNLTMGFFEMRTELAKVWLTRSDDSYVFRPIMEALKRADVDFVTDSQNPSAPSQTGIVICVPDPRHPSATARKLFSLFEQTGVPTSYDVIAERQRSRKDDAPSLVIYAAPPPL